ncbi:MAG: RluA family pseudouridine synthase [Clostridia bacterium]|nr:RluA family pseudouridine synthase [Clostridia bacterium]
MQEKSRTEQKLGDVLHLTGDGRRLDVLLTQAGLSRSRAAKLIEDGRVFVGNMQSKKPSLRPETGVSVRVELPQLQETTNLPQDIPIEILYEDEYLAAVNKPAGLVVHPAAGNEDGTLVNALLYHLNSLSGIGGERRPGIVHRLDKDTSGLLLVAKDDATHLALSEMLAERRIEKHYRAIVLGRMKDETGYIDAPIGRSQQDRKKMAIRADGRPSQTEWRVLKALDHGVTSYLDVHIITGRTHQIRVHMASIGHPVLGDPIYGFQHMPPAKRLMLHSYSIRFIHPATGREMTLTAPCPFEPTE